MTLQIALSPDSEARLSERAAAEGKDPATFAREAIEEKLASENGVPSAGEMSLQEWQEGFASWISHLESWGRAHLPPGHSVDDSRESIYEGRGE